MTYWGGVEAGGTKFVCGVCDNEGRVLDRRTLSTQSPLETIPQVVDYFTAIGETYPLSGIGLASFGPLDLDPESATYGFITSTPKDGWRNFGIQPALETRLQREIPFDTDVNGAVLAESVWGAARGKQNAVYITVGTGIGGGVLVNGALVHGLLHPEIGHMRVHTNREWEFTGVCGFHEYCLEGLASGPAIQARWGRPAEDLPEDHPAWEAEAAFLAEGIASLILTISPQIIILGGGVMSQRQLFPLIHQQVKNLLNGYVQHPSILTHIEDYIVPPDLGKDAGLLGAAALAMRQSVR